MSSSLNRVGMALLISSVAPSGMVQAQTAGNPLDQLPTPRVAPTPAPGSTAPRVEGQAPAGPAGRLAQSVLPTRFDIEGVSAVPFADIARVFSPSVRQGITVARLVELSQEATAIYKNNGYPLAFVYVPDQDFKDGVVRVVAVEGFIADIRIDGDAGGGEPMLRAMASRLLAEKPLTLATFERVSQLMARLPGLNAQASASLPTRTDGATTLVLKVKRQPYNLSLGADLRQPTPRAVLTGVWNDPIASGSQLTASTLLGNPSRERLVSLGYTQFVGTDGLMFKASHSNYRGYPDEDMDRGSRIERLNTNRRTELSAGYPLFLDARTSVMLNGGFYAVDNVDAYTVPLSGVRLAEDTRMRAVFAQLAYTDGTPQRSRNASVMLAQGIDGLGASATTRSNLPGLATTNPAKIAFTRLAIDAGQRDRFDNQWGTGVSFGAQYSPHTLAASERVSFGGGRFGRGYAAGDAAGDSGWGIGLEVNRQFKLGGTWLKQVEPYLLFEAAKLSTHTGEPSPRDLRSVALGVRLSDARYYSVDLAVAKPTGDAALSNPARKPRISVLLSYQLDAP